jgi:hypothetical protein
MLLPALAIAFQKPATVEGVALNSATGAPVKKALITLRSEVYYAGYQVLTDASGRFRFPEVSPGKYALCAEAQGFVPTVPDGQHAASPAFLVTVGDSQPVKDLSIRLDPYAVVSGKVVDANGDPVRGASVRALRHDCSRSGKKLYPGASLPDTSNDRGEFRIFNLLPGRWTFEAAKDAVAVKATGRVHRSAASTVYTRVQAGPMDLAPGAEITNIEIRLAQAPVYHVRGKVVDTRTGLAAPQGRVHVDGEWYSTLKPDATFDLTMPAGSHWVVGDTAGSDKLYSPVEQVTIVDRDVEGLTIRLGPPISVQGRVLIDGAGANVPARVVVEPLAGLFPGTNARAEADSSFHLDGLAPQQYG